MPYEEELDDDELDDECPLEDEDDPDLPSEDEAQEEDEE
jgi:hypothetical protein